MVVDNDANTYECRKVDTCYTSGRAEHDFAILECLYQIAGTFLDLSDNMDELIPGSVVDIIGYPGKMTRAQEEGFEKRMNLNCNIETLKEAEEMFPLKTLIASRGSIEQIENGLIRYKLSTLNGMSGACLMYKGKVYGDPVDFSVLTIGVHIGECTDGLRNHAISFSTPAIRDLLYNHCTITVTDTQDDYMFVEVGMRGSFS